MRNFLRRLYKSLVIATGCVFIVCAIAALLALAIITLDWFGLPAPLIAVIIVFVFFALEEYLHG